MRRWHLLGVVVGCAGVGMLLWPVAVESTTSAVASPHQVDQSDMATAIVGWLAIVAAMWVGSTSAVIWAVGFFSETRARALALLISPRPLQRWTHSLVGLSLTAGLAAPAPGAGLIEHPEPPPTTIEAGGQGNTAVMRPLGPADDAPPAESTSTTAPASPVPTVPEDVSSSEERTPASTPVSMAPSTTVADLTPSTTVPTSSTTSSTPTTPAPSRQPPPTSVAEPLSPAAPEPAPARASAGDREIVVEPGDSFWSIAVDEIGATAPERTVASYWVRLIEANRDRLVVADEPDLIYPGQVLVLPD